MLTLEFTVLAQAETKRS